MTSPSIGPPILRPQACLGRRRAGVGARQSARPCAARYLWRHLLHNPAPLAPRSPLSAPCCSSFGPGSQNMGVNAAERLSRSSLSGHFSHHHTAVDRSLTALCTELKGQLYIDGGAMEVVTGLFTKCMCFHLSSCYICMHPLAFRAVSMQDLANAPALRPRGPLCALCVSRQTKGHRGRKIPGNKWAVHMDPGEVPSACGPRAPPAWRRRPHGYGVYGTANSYSVLRTCSAYGRCVVRLWAAHVCRSFLSDRLKCSTSIRTYGIEGTPIVSNRRLSRGTLDSRGVGM